MRTFNFPKLKKRLINNRIFTLLVLVVVIFNFFSPKILPDSVFGVNSADIDENELLSLANQERRSLGISELSFDSRLMSAAQKKGEHMIANDYWSHFAPDGTTPWDFILAEGYDYIFAGENLAKDFSSSAPLHAAWMASPTHRDNIVNPNFSDIGIAVVEGDFQGKDTIIVVVMFGRLKDESSNNIESVSDIKTPITGGGELEKPVITDPKNGDILNNGIFSIRGNVYAGDSIKIYDNNGYIGNGIIDFSQQKFAFNPEVKYSDGEHLFTAENIDSQSGKEATSDGIYVTVDTILPNIVTDSFELSYVQSSSDIKKYFFVVKIEDNPYEVYADYNGEIKYFVKSDDLWQVEITGSEFYDLKITALDKAGNSASTTISSQILTDLSSNNPFANIQINVKKWFVDGLINRFFTKSIQGKVNFIIILIVFVILAAERLLLDKTGLTKNSSNSVLHLPVFLILILVSLIGGGGEIL